MGFENSILKLLPKNGYLWLQEGLTADFVIIVFKIVCFVDSKTSIVLAADESVVSWGPSPTYGELVSNGVFCTRLSTFC